MGQPPFRLILASGSPARRELLTRAGYQFEVMPADIDEPTEAGYPDARTLVEHVAWLKAAAVAPRVTDGPALILAADTVGWLHGRPIGKPVDEADARRILRLLAGTEHELWTGVCLWRRPDDLQIAWQEVSRVAIRPLTEAELDAYLATRVWQGCSGAYAIQEDHDPYVRVVQGSISNVIGLPMQTSQKVILWVAGTPALGPGGASFDRE
jgi:nucleoside triphosphate pyrophosphatase